MSADEAYDEALSRIKSLQGDSLELELCDLERLPIEVSALSSLRSLSIDGMQINDISPIEALTELRYLNLGLVSQCQIESFEPLRKLRKLEVLNLSGRGETQISPLQELSELRELNLSFGGISDIAPLRNLRNLEILNLQDSDGPLTDISPLAGLTKLRSLDLSGHEEIADLTPLCSLTRLTVLRLAETRVTDLTPLRDLPLEELDLTGDARLDYSGLAHLRGLRRLGLTKADSVEDSPCINSDLSALGKLADLEELNLHLPAISLAFLETCCRLKSLVIGGQRSTDLSSFASLREVETLQICFFPNLSDVSALSCLKKLSKLEISFCEQLTDVSSIASLTQLKNLKILVSDVRDLSALGSLHALEQLEVIHCRWLANLGSFRELRRLRKLLIESGTFSDLSGLEGLPELEYLAIAGCENVTDIGVVATLPKIKHVCFNASMNIARIRPLEKIIDQLESVELDGCYFEDARDLPVSFEEDMTDQLRSYFGLQPKSEGRRTSGDDHPEQDQ